MKPCPVIDLHCDLLSFLAEDLKGNTPLQEDSRCSLPLLEKGGVLLQALAIFTETQKGSRKRGEIQLECYQNMRDTYQLPCEFALAIENASGLLEEGEDLGALKGRLEEQQWLYISMTWKEENRFGGGDQTQVGLKEDGRELLKLMDGKGIAIDLSHASDPLAEGILEFIDKENLKVLPIASHSNFRAVKDHVRNLPDHLAKEIIRRGGLIGINFVRHFVGDAPEDFLKHVEHGLSLGEENALALGADFFGGIPTPAIEHLKPFYQSELGNSSSYPVLYEILSNNLQKGILEGIFFKNARRVLKNKLRNQ